MSHPYDCDREKLLCPARENLQAELARSGAPPATSDWRIATANWLLYFALVLGKEDPLGRLTVDDVVVGLNSDIALLLRDMANCVLKSSEIPPRSLNVD